MSIQPEPFDAPQPDPYASRGAQRVMLPGVFLIVVGVLNLFAGGCFGYMGYTFTQIPAADLQKAYEQQVQNNPQQKEAMQQYHIESGEDLRPFYVKGGYGWAAVTVPVALLIMLGGLLMCLRKARGFAIFSAVLAAVPVISPMACCLIGMGVGIWALVVLFSADGKAAFS